MVDMELLSDNLTLILNQLISNQKIVKYLYYNEKSPQGKPDVKLPAKNLILSKIHPYPFDPIATTEEGTEIRVYFPEGQFDGSRAVADTFLHIDIVTAKSLWLTNDNDKSQIRPYMIMKEIIEHFAGKSIGTLGRMNFHNFIHLHINDKFDALRIEAEITLFGG